MTRNKTNRWIAVMAAACIPLLAAGCWEKTGISCPDGNDVCEGACVDTQTDTSNCGACGTACDGTEVCSGGVCGAPCDAGLDLCSGACVDLQADPTSCGACGNPCDPGEVCDAGSCELFCSTGLTDCDGGCVDTDTNRFNCGGCDDGNGSNTCATGEVCTGGVCELTCGGSTPTLCGTACVNTDSDRSNCGGCDDGAGSNTCAPDEICATGTCVVDFLCGNSVVDPGETCDDGNTTGGDGCNETCSSDETCGNFILDVTAGEACDDGNNIDGDGCQATCALPSCGDGILDSFEVCDDTNIVSGDGCNATCTSDETCGNAILDVAAGEACDDGNAVDGDGCQADCTLPNCGDGVLDPGEVCDDGNNVDGDGTCNANCTSDESCGNGVLDLATGEACDDGNNVDGDGCQADCSLPSCGDGILDPGEVCDDGNNVNGDGTCNANCTSDESCGNGVLDAPGEGCDDGNNVDGDGCQANCALPVCGDAIVDPGEACDDGNNVNGDGTCNANCTSDESCGNGVLDTAMTEACDDGNNVDGDGCQADCSLPNCGDGILDPGEVCDDGNNVDGDGTCNANCTSDESCGNAVLDAAMGEECDDGNLVAGDGCDGNCLIDCIAPLSDCVGTCVNRDYDPLNCGGCGTVCGGLEACVGGICTPLAMGGTDVLIIGDGDGETTVNTVLTTAGYNVTIAPVLETGYDGTNPDPSAFCAVVHLNGETFTVDMPVAGQVALDAYVNAGGGFVGMEWNAYEEANGRLASMTELILLVRAAGHSPNYTYTLNAAGLIHPVTAGLPASFSFTSSGNTGVAKGGMGITVLATEGANDAVAVRDYGAGRVVHYNHAGHYATYTVFADPNVAQLLVQSVTWLCAP